MNNNGKVKLKINMWKIRNNSIYRIEVFLKLHFLKIVDYNRHNIQILRIHSLIMKKKALYARNIFK